MPFSYIFKLIRAFAIERSISPRHRRNISRQIFFLFYDVNVCGVRFVFRIIQSSFSSQTHAKPTVVKTYFTFGREQQTSHPAATAADFIVKDITIKVLLYIFSYYYDTQGFLELVLSIKHIITFITYSYSFRLDIYNRKKKNYMTKSSTIPEKSKFYKLQIFISFSF